MIHIAKDVTDLKAPPFIVADHQITNANGSVSFVLADGTVAGQEPNAYGVRHDAPSVAEIGVYQMFTVSGALVTIQTRPQDPMFTYTLAFGRAY